MLGGFSQPTDVRMLFGLSGRSSVCSCRPSAVPPDGRALVSTANKQGKNIGCIASAACGSLWRPFGSVWRFQPRKSRPGSLYLCTRATGRTMRLHAAVEIGSPAIRLRTDFYVRRNIARCVSSNSIRFGLLPKTLPLQGAGLSPPKSGSLIPNLRLARAWWLMSRNH